MKPDVKLIEGHRYIVDGKPCLSTVTRELEKAGLSKYWNKDSWYMERGNAVHIATHLIDRGLLDWDTVDPRIEGFLEAYLKFKKESGIVFEYREVSLYDPIYRFCGTPDAFYPLTDIKTGQENDVQLGAYWHLLKTNGYKVDKKAYSLLLFEDGTYKFNPIREDIEMLANVFLCALTVNRYKENKNLY
ncbi:MAG: hypothetical protein DDT22_00941 [candidate division WS2 bacterium]|nr:hypothetical protein [Bacillota bacterium]MBT9175267.1 hypothetical protein [Candidatus Lithacetigena glycinireducens]